MPWALDAAHRQASAAPTDTIDTRAVRRRARSGCSRPRRTRTVATGSRRAPHDVMIVSGRAKFDFVGRTVERTTRRPSRSAAPGIFQTRRTTRSTPTRTAYDVLDRTTAHHASPTAPSARHGLRLRPGPVGATQFETTVTDANGKQQRTYRDVRQLDHGRQGVQHTGRRRPAGDLDQLRLRPAGPARRRSSTTRNNRTRRRLRQPRPADGVDSPTPGKTETVYDLAVNLIAKITAEPAGRGQADRLRLRLQPAHERSATRTSRGNNVTYTYGAPGASDNRAGRITPVTDESGAGGALLRQARRDHQGDQDGRERHRSDTVRRLHDPVPLRHVRPAAAPDLPGRRGPDVPLRLAAARSGRPSASRAAITLRLHHAPRVRQVRAARLRRGGNGDRTTYSYRPGLTAGCSNLRADAEQRRAPFQNLDYTYDNVGNVLGLDNDVAVPPASQYGGPTSQTFRYDDLYRLTSAERQLPVRAEQDGPLHA